MFPSVCIVLHLPYFSLRRLEFEEIPIVNLIATPRESIWREPWSTSDLSITADEPVDISCLADAGIQSVEVDAILSTCSDLLCGSLFGSDAEIAASPKKTLQPVGWQR